VTVPVLTLDGVAKSFGGLRVIDDVSFQVPEGSRTALIGPNGSGKTTTFNLISGIYEADAGAIRLRGDDVTAMAPHRRARLGIARSFQNIRLMPHLSVIENVMLGQHSRAGGLLAKLTPLARAGRWVGEAKRLLDDAGLASYEDQIVSDLPYGIQKRIEVVRAMAAQPRLLLLDEPAAGLNPRETAELRDLLERAVARNVTLLVIEHDMSFVHKMCDSVIVLNFGRKIAEGPLDEVRRDPAVLDAYLGRDDAGGSDAA
jgi:branched-chain amino acid transport system ATP-binding protein